MKTLLEIDAGNTNIKWRLRCGERVIARGCESKEFSSIDQFPALDELRIVSVRAPEKTESIIRFFSGKAVQIFVARALERCGEMVNAYDEAGTLGVDRWSGLVGAYFRYGGGVVVIDAGTAITIDYLSVGGCHLGGYILPGIEMQFRALYGSTAGVRGEVALSAQVNPGSSTVSCVTHGISLFLAAGIRAAIDEGLARSCSRVILTGGGSSALSWVVPSAIVDEDLVLDGLAQLAEHEVK